MSKDQLYMIDYVASELILIIMQKQNISFQDAVDLLYSSQLYDKLQDVETGLYLQSPCYNYESLEHELKYGKIA